MFGLVREMVDFFTFKPEKKVCLIGECDSGKTFLSYSISDHLSGTMMLQNRSKPTCGLNIIKVECDRLRFRLWDLPGNEAFRSMWFRYAADSELTVICVTGDVATELANSGLASNLDALPDRVAIIARGTAEDQSALSVWEAAASSIPLADPCHVALTFDSVPPLFPASNLRTMLGSIGRCGASAVDRHDGGLEAVAGTMHGRDVLLVKAADSDLGRVGERVLAWGCADER